MLFILYVLVHEVTVYTPTDHIMPLKRGVIVFLSVFGAVKLLSVPWLFSLLAGLGLCMAWGASWKFIRVALYTIKRDLM